MEQENYTERDWQLFRSRIPQWQEAYIGKLNEDYVALLTADGNASEKFWALEKRLKKDKRSVGVCVEMKRSELIWNLRLLLYDGVISRADLNDFSERLQETLDFLLHPEAPDNDLILKTD